MTKFIFIVLIISAPSIFPQQQKKYFDAPFGGGIGYVPAWYFPNVDPINFELQKTGMPKLSTSGFYSSGGAGFVYVGFIKFLRIGGMGYGGSISTSEVINGFNKEVVYNLGGGGLTIEYTLPFIKDIGLSIGAIIGAGNLEIQMFSNKGSFSWQGGWEEFGSDSTDSFSRTMNNSFWMLTPTLNLDVPINRFIMVRLGAGYQIAFNDDWTANNDQELNGVPSDLNANTFFVQSGIFIGFFSF